MKVVFTSLLLLLNGHLLLAQMSGIPTYNSDTLYSEVVGDQYILQITLPYPFDPANNKYPVLYYLDAFTTAARMNELAKDNMWSQNIDPMVLVGISYNTNPYKYSKQRERDYIPNPGTSEEIHASQDFMQFMLKELFPYVEQNYGADPDNRGLMGFSLGGLFTAWTICESPGAFQKLAILSPSLQLDDRAMLGDPALPENIARLEKLDVFLSYGSDEGSLFIQLGDILEEELRRNKNIQVERVTFQDEDHATVHHPASARALLRLYENPFKAMLKQVYALYDAGEFQQAIGIQERALASYPEEASDNDHYGLACLYALTGEIDKAFDKLNKLDPSYRDWPEKLHRDEDLSALHEDSRWAEVLDKLQVGAGD